jgi:hypothetical protein
MSNKNKLHPQFRGGDYWAKQAAEYSKHCTPDENRRRQENGRTPNVADVVAILPSHEVLDASIFPNVNFLPSN